MSLGNLVRRLFPPLLIWPRLLSLMLILELYGLVVAVVIWLGHLPTIEWGTESTVLDGLVLGFLIAFRNNHAYDRWWEARRLWGQLTNEIRNLCIKLRTLGGIGFEEREELARLLSEFGWTLLAHLRRGDQPGHGSGPAQDDHPPSRVAWAIAQRIAGLRDQGKLDGYAVLWMNDELRSLMSICGSCERIRHTPLSSSYRAMLRHGIAIYLVVAPFYLIEDAGLAGFPVFSLAVYFLLGVELVAEEIEEPFGTGGDNLPLERYCVTIESSARQLLVPQEVPG